MRKGRFAAAVGAVLLAANAARADSVLVFNELMYHPAGDAPALEWVELYNQLAYDLDISGWRLRGGVDYDFPDGTVVPGRGFIVVAANPSLCTNAVGPFSGQLSNAGEKLTLYSRSNREMNVLEYGDGGAWPVPPDGSGCSLAKTDADAGNDAANWRWSATSGGTPGSGNTTQAASSLVIHETAGATNADWWIELSNAGDTGLNPSGCVVSAAGDAGREVLITNTWLPAGGLLVVSAPALHPAVDEPVFLYAAGGLSVLDGRAVKSSPRALTADGAWLRPAAETPGETNRFALCTDIVINEIMYHQHPQMEPYVESPEQWVELFNRGTQDVDVSGWKFTDGISFEFPSNTIMAAGAYCVVAWDTNAMATSYPALGPALYGPFGGKLSRTGERLRLEDADGNPADEVHYQDSGRWADDADGFGSSLELIDSWADNAVPESWAASDESGKAAWRSYTNIGVSAASRVGADSQWKELVMGLLNHGEVLIDDVSVVESPSGAATELIQNGTFDADTVGGPAAKWRIIGTHRRSVVADDPANPGGRCLRLNASDPTEHMHNHAETTFAGGKSVTDGLTYRIRFRARWVHGCRQLNTRLYFNRLPKTFLLDVPDRTGTPGAPNSRLTGNVGPACLALSHGPIVPGTGTTIRVRATLEDFQGVGAVTNWYSVNEGSWVALPMTNAGGSVFGADIPGQAAGAVVQFYIEARDGLGAVSLFPAGGRSSRALVRVQDGQASTNGLHNLRITMLASDAAWMHATTNVMSNDPLGATVVYDEREVFYNVGVHLKSSQRHRLPDTEVGFHVIFDPGQPFRGVHGSVSVDRSQGIGFGQREMISRLVMNRVGGDMNWYSDLIRVIAPRSQNTSAAELQMARYGGVYLDEQFENGSDGDTYMMEYVYYPTTTDSGQPEGNKLPQPDSVQTGTLADWGTDKEAYRWTQQIGNNLQRDRYDRIAEFSKVAAYANPTFNAQIGSYIDVSQWLRSMAVGTSDGTSDNFVQNGMHNVVFYVRPGDSRVLCLQHDHDAFYSTTYPLIANSYLTKLVAEPSCDREFCGATLDVLNHAYNTNYLGRWLRQFTTLLAPQDFNSYASFIRDRNVYLMTQVMSRVAAAYPFTVVQPATNAVAADRIALQGDGWIDVAEIRVDGMADPLALTWTSTGSGATRSYSWHATVLLQPGTNTLRLRAFDAQGNEVGSGTVTVISTLTGWPLGDSLRVTELMFDPPAGTAGEFIEFQNTGTGTISLATLTLTNAVQFSFSGGAVTNLAPCEFVVVAADPAALQSLYPTNAMNVAGMYTGKLANEGETVEVLDNEGRSVLKFQYGSGRGWPLAACGAGHSLVPQDSAVAAQPQGSLDYGRNWRASSFRGGSPGAADPALLAGPVLNEILAHTDVVAPPYDSNDRIELYNGTSGAIPLDDYYLSDDKGDLRKWAIPAGTVLGPGEWIVFDEMTGFHSPITNGFGLDKAGEQVLLSFLPGNASDRIVDAVRFEGQERDISLGHYPDGGEWWLPMPPTPGAANAAPIRSAVVRAFMYHPRALADGETNSYRREYIEIFNPTPTPIPLTSEGGAWRLSGAAELSLPGELELEPGHSLLAVPFDPADSNAMRAVLEEFGETDRVQRVVGPWGGRLSDSGERVSLEKPLLGDLPGDPLVWVIVDETIYFHQDPWPAGADGTGAPLRRRLMEESGNNPQAWEPGRTQLVQSIAWALNDGSGAAAADSFGNGRHGALTDVLPANGDGSTLPVWTAGRGDGGLLFDGVDDAVRYSPSPVTSFPFSFSAWVRTTNQADATAVFLGDPASPYFYFALGTAGGKAELASHSVSGTRGRYALNGAKTVADGQWHFLVGVFSGVSSRAIYVDGALDGALGRDAVFPPTAVRFTAGLQDGSSVLRPWRGELDDVRLYASALTLDDCRMLFYGLPWEPDADVDGVPDSWQADRFGGLCVAGSRGDEDPDGDGATNEEEYRAGTDPTNATSVLRMELGESDGTLVASCRMQGASGPGYEGASRFYSLLQSSNLWSGVWSALPGFENVPGSDGFLLYTNDLPSPRFFSTRATLVP